MRGLLSLGGRRLFASNFAGLANRLESLPLSFAISEHFGHEVCLDWPELDAFEVQGARTRRIHPWDRIGSIKVQKCNDALFYRLGNFRTIIQRSTDSPSAVTDAHYLSTFQRVRLKQPYVDALREAFSKYDARPVVGVHIRRGDFRVVDEDSYDVMAKFHQAIPLWWYDHAMRQFTRGVPDVAFFLSYSGPAEDIKALKETFPVFELPLSSNYERQRPTHTSIGHPVADLFGLACCNIIIATPRSSFSHIPANALGHPSKIIAPAASTNRDAPMSRVLEHHGKRFAEWAASLGEDDPRTIIDAEDKLPRPARPSLDWLQAARP